MIRRPWSDSKPGRWEDDQRRYRIHLRRIDRRLPFLLREFTRQFVLHDDRFAGGLLIPEAPLGRDAVVLVYLYCEEVVGAAALLTLHFVGITGVFSSPPRDVSIMYFDVEIAREGVFRLSFALAEGRKWSVSFRAFSYQVYEYLKPA